MQYYLPYSGNIKNSFEMFILHAYSEKNSDEVTVNFSYGTDAGDFVCEVLNQNYFAMVEEMQCNFNFDEVPLSIEETFEHDRREELREVIIKELSELDFSLIKKIAQEVFCNAKYETLSTKEKFFAFDKALRLTSEVKNPFLEGIQVYTSLTISRIIRNYQELISSYRENDIINVVSDDFTQVFAEICATLKNDPETVDIECLMRFGSIKDVFIYLFAEMVRQNGVIKKCPNCERFFSPFWRSDANYCLYPSPQDPKKTCQQYVSYANYLRKTQTDMATKLHKQIYNIKLNHAKRNPDNEELWEDVETFLAQSRQWKKDVKNGSADEAQYIEWLQKIKDNDA